VELSSSQEKNQRKPEKVNMHFQMRKCTDCKRYTLKEECPKCGHETTTVHPGKYSPDDKYARYRISDRYK
jgi:H/ACA ribonucleoprotein complex subunit 3